MESVPQISSALLFEIIRSVTVALGTDDPVGLPGEKCGILRGRGQRIIRADRAANVSPTPQHAFEIDPADLIRAYRGARRRNGLDVLGFYHTHPSGDDAPSSTDAACAAPDGKLWLIAAKGKARLWRAVDNGGIHGRFDPVEFDLVVGKRAPERVGGVTLR